MRGRRAILASCGFLLFKWLKKSVNMSWYFFGRSAIGNTGNSSSTSTFVEEESKESPCRSSFGFLLLPVAIYTFMGYNLGQVYRYLEGAYKILDKGFAFVHIQFWIGVYSMISWWDGILFHTFCTMYSQMVLVGILASKSGPSIFWHR